MSALDTGLLRLGLRAALAMPDVLARPLLGPTPTNDRGVTMDAALWRMVGLQHRVFGGITKREPAAARAEMRRSISIVASRPDAPLEVRDDQTAGGLPVRVYRPPAPRAVMVYFHGGGWVQGDLDTHDNFCRRLAAEANRLVISVHYRLAPEHPWPAAAHDAIAAFHWAREVAAAHALTRVEVGGDSAGGNLAAVVSIAMRDAGGPSPALQLLIYPGLDQTRSFASHRTLGDGYVLTARDIDWFQAHYNPALTDPLASPWHVASTAGLAPAIVTTSGFDPLRDEGEAYAVRLREGGVPVTHLDEADLVHGYVSMDGVIPAADRAVGRILAALRAAG